MMADLALLPYGLTWDEADPARHPFGPGTAAEVVRGPDPALAERLAENLDACCFHPFEDGTRKAPGHRPTC
jgi:hypothetical protein